MDNQSENSLAITRIYTAFISLAFSLLAFYNDDLINSDGILYLHLAQAFLDGGLSATRQIFDWPFFSILIAGVHRISSLPLELCANILNSGLFVLLTDALLLISSRLVTNRVQLITAAILILSFYPLNVYREFIVRDIGYWAFGSIALLQFIKSLDQAKISSSTNWQIAMLIATLFRVEGIIILLTLPLYNFFIHRPINAIKQVFHSLYLVILAALTTIAIFIGKTSIEATFDKLSPISTRMDFDHIIRLLNKNSDILASQVLSHYSDKYSMMVLVSGLLFMLLFKLIKTFSFSYFALSVMSIWHENRLILKPVQSLLIYFITINIIILIVFLAKNYFISSRYAVMALIGLLLLFLPVISQMLERAWRQKNKLVLAFSIFLISVSLIDSFNKSSKKTYIKETALWASANLPADSLVLTDDQFLNYYFNTGSPNATLCVGPTYQKPKEVDYRGVTAKQRLQCKPYIKQGYQAFNYLVVVKKSKNKQLGTFLTTANLEPLFESKNKRGDKAVVYKIFKVQR